MFPPVQLITLQETPEREAHAIYQLSKLGLAYQIHRFQKHPEAGWKGCIDSHLRVYQYAADRNVDWIFICEDNILAHDNVLPYKKYSNLFKFIDTCPDWGIIFTGGYILRPWDYCKPTKYTQVYETRNNNHGTVSYMIHSRLYKQILTMHKLSPINVHFDIFISQFTCYIYNPLLFYHAHNIKSNINQKSDIWRQVWFHPKVMPIHSFVFFNRQSIWLILFLMLLGIWWYKLKSQRNRTATLSGSSGTVS